MNFQKTYVINLKSRTDRKAQMKNTLKKMGIKKIEFIEATTRSPDSWNSALIEIERKDKKIYTNDLLKKLSSTNEKLVKTKQGEIGNFLSHIRIWSKIAKQKPGYYLILEDDVCLSDHWFNKKKDALFHKIKGDFMFLFLGDCWREKRTLNCSSCSNGLIRDFTYCSHAYVITPAFGMIIDSLCRQPGKNALFPLVLPTDFWISNFLINYDIPFYIYKKPLIVQYLDSVSDIGEKDDSRMDIDPETQLTCSKKM